MYTDGAREANPADARYLSTIPITYNTDGTNSYRFRNIAFNASEQIPDPPPATGNPSNGGTITAAVEFGGVTKTPLILQIPSIPFLSGALSIKLTSIIIDKKSIGILPLAGRDVLPINSLILAERQVDSINRAIRIPQLIRIDWIQPKPKVTTATKTIKGETIVPFIMPYPLPLDPDLARLLRIASGDNPTMWITGRAVIKYEVRYRVGFHLFGIRLIR